MGEIESRIRTALTDLTYPSSVTDETRRLMPHHIDAITKAILPVIPSQQEFNDLQVAFDRSIKMLAPNCCPPSMKGKGCEGPEGLFINNCERCWCEWAFGREFSPRDKREWTCGTCRFWRREKQTLWGRCAALGEGEVPMEIDAPYAEFSPTLRTRNYFGCSWWRRARKERIEHYLKEMSFHA